MKTTTAIVNLDFPGARRHITLSRTPKYLRFVVKGNDWKTLDALDQLDDHPAVDETVLPAVLKHRGSIHYDGIRNGKRFGEWHHTATYVLVENPPPDDVLRDTAKRREWCVSREAKSKKEV